MVLSKEQVQQVLSAMDREDLDEIDIVLMGDGKLRISAVEVKTVFRPIPLTRRSS